MRDPAAVNPAAAAGAKRVAWAIPKVIEVTDEAEKTTIQAIETAKEHLYWNLLGPWRWEDSRWSGLSPTDEREQEFRYAMGEVRKEISERVPDPELRKYLTKWLEQVPSRPRPQKKGVLREQTNALRNLYIADTVAMVQSKHRFNVRQACLCVAKALHELKLPVRSKKSVETIWNKRRHRYPDLLSGK